MSNNANFAPVQLQEIPLRFELTGRLRNITKLKHWQMAVAEAVKNSLDAIAESGRSGTISIEVERVKDLASGADGHSPVKSIVVRDNGIGFNDDNYLSFCTSDSLQKQKQGGKGLGRLTCLQAFRRIRVRSAFKDKDGWRERRLVLQSEHPELSAMESPSDATSPSTEVRLEELRPEFDAGAAIDANLLAEWLSEHFLPALVERPKWLQSLTLLDEKEHIDLTRVIEGGSRWVEKFNIGGYDFRAVCYSVTSGEDEDMVRFVAGGNSLLSVAQQ